MRHSRGAPLLAQASGLFLCVSLSLASPPASAQGVETSTQVTLTDGSVFRGELVESIPGQHVVLRLATGEVRKLSWDTIASSVPVPALPPPPPQRPSAPAESVQVRFTADGEGAVLEQQAANGQWAQLCPAPCTTAVAPGHIFRVTGRGILKSRPFQLPADRNSVNVDATVGGKSQPAWGAILAIGGGGLVVFVGLPLLLVGILAESIDDPIEEGTRSDFDGTPLIAAGGIVTAGGIVMGIVGLNMLLDSGTRVDVSKRPEPRLALPGGLSLSPQGLLF